MGLEATFKIIMPLGPCLGSLMQPSGWGEYRNRAELQLAPTSCAENQPDGCRAERTGISPFLLGPKTLIFFCFLDYSAGSKRMSCYRTVLTAFVSCSRVECEGVWNMDLWDTMIPVPLSQILNVHGLRHPTRWSRYLATTEFVPNHPPKKNNNMYICISIYIYTYIYIYVYIYAYMFCKP